MRFFRRDKPQLQLALYARPKYPNTYHYALLVSSSSPRNSSGAPLTKHHVKNTLQNTAGLLTQPWIYETEAITISSKEPRLLACIIIAKLALPTDRLNAIIRGTSIYQVDDPSGKGQTFDCVEWVRLALEQLKMAGALTETSLDWDFIRKQSLQYVERKTEEGRWQVGWTGGNADLIATYDMLKSKEVVP